jgi:peptide/nickel transport system substrate-binding protein
MLIYNSSKNNMCPGSPKATRWSDDASTLTFELRRGVSWSDGQPFTARDVVYTFELLKKFKALDQNALWLKLLAVEQEGDHRVHVRFGSPSCRHSSSSVKAPSLSEHHLEKRR